MAALVASQALQSRSAYFPGDSEADASSSTTVNTSASQPRRRQDAAPPSLHSNPVISRTSFASASRHKSAQAFLPAVVLRQQAFKSLQEQSGAVKQLQVPAAWHVGVSNAVSLAVGACPSDLAEATFSMPIVQEQKELHECCFGDSALELAQHLTAAVESGLNVRAPASMQQIYSVSCHSNAAQLHCQVAVPGASVLLTPLYAKKVCQVPLSQSLQDGQQQATVKASQNGLLSMDQARSLLPLLADDPNDIQAEKLQRPAGQAAAKAGGVPASTKSSQTRTFMMAPMQLIQLLLGLSLLLSKPHPAQQHTIAAAQEPLRSADRQNSAVLNPEASLAHLHQPAAPAAEAVSKASRAMQSSAGMEEAGRTGPEGDAQGVQQATEAGIDTAALQKEVTELKQQLQRLMLQMAANAAAPPARSSRTAETSTSTLWAPGAALLQRQLSSLSQPSSLQDSQHQQPQQQEEHFTQLQASLRVAPDSGNGNEPGAQHAQHESQPASSAAPSEVHAAEDSDAASTESHDQTSVQSQAQGAPCSIVSHSMQQPSKRASHHDAHEPWASQWAQPALPALTLPTAQSCLDRPGDLQQHRRATAADVPVSRTLQQQAMRNSSGLQAARSLSWSQPAAGDSPIASQPSSDVRSSAAGSLLMHQIEPATPPASFQREESGAGAEAAQQTTIAWEGYPQVGAQWGLKQETVRVGTVTADSHVPINLSEVTNQDQHRSAPVPSDRSEALHEGAELDCLAPPSDQEGPPLLITSASPQKALQYRAGTASKAASAASSLAANSMLLSGSGTGMMTVVRTQFVPLGDSLSDSDSDSEDIRLEQKYGIIRGCRRKSSMAVSHRDSSSSFLPDMSLDSRMYLHMHGVWQPSMNSLSASEDLHPD
ncbi:MAG: hypothetical protein FRX49_01837 [Trebouxia sp. A1-2]|nr:MAG: hypothetical protein FRX49_01837 [Trebouxia sp. A1-2]